LLFSVDGVVVVSSAALGVVVVLDTPRDNADEEALALSESRKDPLILLPNEAGVEEKPCSFGARMLSLFIGIMLAASDAFVVLLCVDINRFAPYTVSSGCAASSLTETS
jgi:hypothetical protein